MKYYSIVLILLGLSSFLTLNAQSVIWSEDFANGIPSNWENKDILIPNAQWIWSNDPDTLKFGALPPFSASTAQNGYALFYSDFYNAPHDVRLTTSAIDCSNEDTVYVRFENQYAFYSFGNVSNPQLGVSTDSINFTYYPIFQTIVRNDLTRYVQHEQVNISTQAANQPKVYLRFRWRGNDEYFWKLDDITVQDAPTPPPAHDIAIELFNIYTNYHTPLQHAGNLEFALKIKNNGTASQTNIKIIAKVLELSNNNFLHVIDSMTLPQLAVNDSSNIILNTPFQPTDTGVYQVVYEVSQDSIDQVAYNNIKHRTFIIGNNVFSKDNDTAIDVRRFGQNIDYQVGNIYETKDSISIATKVHFRVAKDLFDGPLQGEQIGILLYEVNANVNDVFSNFDINSNKDVTLVGFSNHIMGSTPNYGLVSADIIDVNTNNQGVVLKPNTKYFMMLSFIGSANRIYIALSEHLSYDYNLSTIVYGNNQWKLGGFGSNGTAIVRMLLQSHDVNTTPIAKLSNENLTFSPNPASQQVNIKLNFKSLQKDVLLTITDLQGRRVIEETYSNIKDKQLSFNLYDFANGAYIISIFTENGSLSKPFIINKS